LKSFVSSFELRTCQCIKCRERFDRKNHFLASFTQRTFSMRDDMQLRTHQSECTDCLFVCLFCVHVCVYVNEGSEENR
jgi:hypothetical protein